MFLEPKQKAYYQFAYTTKVWVSVVVKEMRRNLSVEKVTG